MRRIEAKKLLPPVTFNLDWDGSMYVESMTSMWIKAPHVCTRATVVTEADGLALAEARAADLKRLGYKITHKRKEVPNELA